MSNYQDANQPGFGSAYPEESKATMVLILGILGVVVCGVLAPVAWIMGNKELEAIDAGRRPGDQRSNANIGRILGMIGTALMVIGFVLGILFFILAVASSA